MINNLLIRFLKMQLIIIGINFKIDYDIYWNYVNILYNKVRNYLFKIEKI